MIAAGTAFDLGGPINKAAGSVALGLNGVSDTFDLTARELAIVIPSIGVGIAALLNNRFGLPDVFNNEEKLSVVPHYCWDSLAFPKARSPLF